MACIPASTYREFEVTELAPGTYQLWVDTELPPGRYDLWVDGFSGSAGPYILSATSR